MFYSFVRFVLSVKNCGYFSANDHLGITTFGFLFTLTQFGRVSVNLFNETYSIVLCFVLFFPSKNIVTCFLANLSWIWVL